MRAITQQTNNEDGKRTKTRPQFVWGIVFTLMLGVASSASAQQSAGVLLQSGLYKEDVNGDLEAAIEIYERVLKEFPEDRPIAETAAGRPGRDSVRRSTNSSGSWSGSTSTRTGVSTARHRLSSITRRCTPCRASLWRTWKPAGPTW